MVLFFVVATVGTSLLIEDFQQPFIVRNNKRQNTVTDKITNKWSYFCQRYVPRPSTKLSDAKIKVAHTSVLFGLRK